jgi:hypothetical protein
LHKTFHNIRKKESQHRALLCKGLHIVRMLCTEVKNAPSIYHLMYVFLCVSFARV